MATPRKFYAVIPVKLERSPVRVHVQGDYLSVVGAETTADVGKVYVGINSDTADIPLSEAIPAETPFSYLTLSFPESEVGKVVTLLVGGEARFYQYRELVTILSDLAGLAKESTLAEVRDKLGGVLLVKISDTAIALPVDVQYRRKESLTLFSGTVTASGSTADISVSDFSAMEIVVKVTAVSGTTPSLSVYVEGKFETTGDYKPLVYVENISSTNIWYLTVTQLIFGTIRVRWVVSGTSPSFTFTVAAEAVV